jgi:hypothetical protein
MMADEIPGLTADASRKYCTMLMKFIQFLEASDDWFPMFDIPVLTTSAKSVLAVVKRVVMNWQTRFVKEERKAQIWRDYNLALQPPNTFDLQLAQSAFESDEFRNRIEAIEEFVLHDEFYSKAEIVKATSLNSDRTIQAHFEFLVQTLASYCIHTNNSPRNKQSST